jgi:hypothetical protein
MLQIKGNIFEIFPFPIDTLILYTQMSTYVGYRNRLCPFKSL